MMFYGQRTIRLKPHVAAKSLLAAPQTQSCQTFQKFQNPAVACCCAGLKNGINEISWNPENSWKWNGKWVPYNQHQPTPKDRDCQFMTFPTLLLKLYHLRSRAHAFNLGVRRQLPPSDDLPCATLPAMVGDPLPALPTVKLGVAQSAHCNHCILFTTSKTQCTMMVLQVFLWFSIIYWPKRSKSRLRLAEALDRHSHRSGNCLDGGPSSWGHRCLWECGCLRRCLKMKKESVKK